MSRWRDLGIPEEGFRTCSGKRRGSIDGDHFVEAFGVQMVDGTLTEVCVRAQITLWDMNRFADWDKVVSPDEARATAVELREQARNLALLASAYESAAAEVDGWSQR